MNERLGLVLGLDQLAPLLIGGRVRLGFLHHALDLGIAQAAGSLDADRLCFVRSLIESRYIHYTIGVDVERHLDLRNSARSRWNTHEIELTEQLVVGRHFAFALEDADRHSILIVLGSREDL